MIASLAPGEVVSYGDVAHDAGRPGAARAVGALLASTDVELPWWRVVRGDGRIVTDNPAAPGRAAARRGRRRPRRARRRRSDRTLRPDVGDRPLT